MNKTGNTHASKMWFVFLYTMVVASLIVGLSTVSFAAKKTAEGSAAIVDINTADEKTLEALPGIGKTTAKAIIAGRPYKSVDDLKRVKGMSDKKIQALKGTLSVGGTTASPATAAASQKVTTAKKKVADTSAATSQKTAAGSAAIVDINTADEKTLEALPGIGKVTAKAIIAGRPYKSVDDLKRVKGMSDKKIQALKGNLSVGSATASSATTAASQKVTAAENKIADTSAATTQKAASAEKSVTEKSSKTAKKLAPGQRININSATKEDLEALPGIGPAKAQAVIDGRPYNAPEDIMKVKGIKQKTFDKLKDYITVR